MLILSLDAATVHGSVALLDGARLLGQADVAMRGEREERLLPAVDQVIEEAGVSFSELDRIVCGGGPGSFTGLRIAASIAKGVAYAQGVPLHSRSSLWLLLAGLEEPLPAGAYRPALDAMRGQLFSAPMRVEADGRVLELGDTQLLSREELTERLRREGARAVGPSEPIQAFPHARGVVRDIAWLETHEPVDLASWEPDYGRLAEAQVRWEAAHGRPLPAG